MTFNNGDVEHCEPETPAEKEFKKSLKGKWNEMRNNEIVKNALLIRKLTEYFSANPKKESVVIRAADGDRKLFWRAERSGNSNFRITEVNTKTKSFVAEINSDRKGTALNPNGAMPISDRTPIHHPLEESSPQFTDLSKAFMDAVGGPPNQAKMQNALKLMQVKAASIKDQGEKQRADNMIANISALANASRVNQKLNPPQQPAQGAPPNNGMPQQPALGKPTGESRKRSLREAASSEFGKASHVFVAAMTPPLMHDKVASAFKQLQALGPAMKEPQEAEQLGLMVHQLAQAADATSPARRLDPLRGKNNLNMKREPPPLPQKPGKTEKKPEPEAEKEKEEQPTEGLVTEGSSQFGQASQQFVAAMTPPFDHAKLSTALKKLNQMIGQITDPAEKNQMGMMIGELTGMVDKTTAGGGSKLNTPAAPTNANAATGIAGGGAAPITQGFRILGTPLLEKKKSRISMTAQKRQAQQTK